MHSGVREALFVVAAALGEACRILQESDNVDSPWHRQFTRMRRCLMGMLGGWEPDVSLLGGDEPLPLPPSTPVPAEPVLTRRLRSVP